MSSHRTVNRATHGERRQVGGPQRGVADGAAQRLVGEAGEARTEAEMRGVGDGIPEFELAKQQVSGQHAGRCGEDAQGPAVQQQPQECHSQHERRKPSPGQREAEAPSEHRGQGEKDHFEPSSAGPPFGRAGDPEQRSDQEESGAQEDDQAHPECA
ncbi:MAG: hypothetical protein HYW52_08960 [Gemmatimonadetes bacterium]|nr:hypothetical protein [Gemmatimonadota bacterium]